MTANPLLDGQLAKSGKVTVEMLHELVERSNRMEWVRASGKPYFVGKRTNGDGTFTHFLDRAI